MSERPNPITMAEELRSLAECWRELNGLLGHSEGAARGGSREGRVPLNLDVLDTMRAIEGFANGYAHILMDESHDWRVPRGGPDALIEGLALRIGHFTHHEDPQIAFSMADELEDVSRRGWHVARPDGKAMIPLGIGCYEEECDGEMRVPIDRDRPMDDGSLALWRPVAYCSKDREHRLDARILAKEKNRARRNLDALDKAV